MPCSGEVGDFEICSVLVGTAWLKARIKRLRGRSDCSAGPVARFCVRKHRASIQRLRLPHGRFRRPLGPRGQAREPKTPAGSRPARGAVGRGGPGRRAPAVMAADAAAYADAAARGDGVAAARRRRLTLLAGGGGGGE